jgi:hypothetical protein
MVKDKVTRSDKLDNLQEFIALIIKINNRIFKRSLEKRGQYLQEHKRKKLYNKYYSLIKLDVIAKTKRHVFKEEM